MLATPTPVDGWLPCMVAMYGCHVWLPCMVAMYGCHVWLLVSKYVRNLNQWDQQYLETLVVPLLCLGRHSYGLQVLNSRSPGLASNYCMEVRALGHFKF